MKHILVLGTGDAQFDLLKKLKGKFNVHACSYINIERSLKYIDKFALIDIVDKNAVLSYCIKNKIDLVYSIGSDIAMPTIAWVSEKLEISSFFDYQTAVTCNAKDKLRIKLGENPYNVKFIKLCTFKKNIGLNYPFMLKPTDNQGQRGVHLVHNEIEYRECFPKALKFSRSASVIAEEFIKGPEICVIALLSNGKIIFSTISDRISWKNYPGGIIHKHRYPSKVVNKKSEKIIMNMVTNILSILKIKDGPVFFQIIYNKRGPKLIEVTPRLDGGHIWKLLKFATGVDLIDLVIKMLVGADKEINDIKKKNNGSWTLEFFCDKPGIIFNKNSYKAKEDSVYHEYFFINGETIRATNGYFEKCGYQVYRNRK